ncbi:Uncharacterised protein [Enterobacter cloacae]|nr:Uncharacterised protein [Enterobacter cloacae]VAM13536.1 Uncharacterised protein [Enterobacter kobei]
MFFCDWYLKNERTEMKGKNAKESKEKKSMAEAMLWEVLQ